MLHGETGCSGLFEMFRRHADRRRLLIVIVAFLFIAGLWFMTSSSLKNSKLPTWTEERSNAQDSTRVLQQKQVSVEPYNHKIDIEQLWFTRECLKVEDKDELKIENIFTIIKSLQESNEPKCKSVYDIFHSIYELKSSYSDVVINRIFSKKVLRWFNGNKILLKETNHQHVMFVNNLYTQESTVFNPLRAKRPGAGGGGGPEVRKFVDKMINDTSVDCDFCNYKSMTAKDPFGSIETKYSVSVSNTFKIEKFHGLVLMKHHNPMHYNEEQLLDFMDVGQKWHKKAHEADKGYTYPHIYWDVLAKASASQQHPHMHVLLASGQYYAKWARLHEAAIDYAKDHNGANYFTHLVKIHNLLGLSVKIGEATAIAYLTPSGSHEVFLISSQPGRDIFRLLFYVMRSFIDEMGLFATSSGMVFPRMIDSPESGDLPMIIRVLYRGAATSNRADVSSIELFGTPNVNVDPYNVIRSIRKTMMKYAVLEE